jgi:hypothetical protein
MRINIAILVAVILAVTVFSTVVLAGDPLKQDKKFLNSDPDGDGILNWEEFIVGTDPFNTDSDNDGLPDWWELEYSQWRNSDPNALMNPTDSSDAHDDLDYDAVSNGTGFNVGEREAQFLALQSLHGGQPVAWPANPDVVFTQPVFDEEGPHYDNYEEFYRPYTDLENQNVIRYMHTNPTKPDTDGDGILDPDDYEPLGWANDGVSPGGLDVVDNSGTDTNFEHPDQNLKILEQPYQMSEENFDFEVEIETTSNTNTPPDNNKNEQPGDIDNDGI